MNAKIVLTSEAALTDSLDNSSMEAAVAKFGELQAAVAKLDEQDQEEIENGSVSSDQQ